MVLGLIIVVKLPNRRVQSRSTYAVGDLHLVGWSSAWSSVVGRLRSAANDDDDEKTRDDTDSRHFVPVGWPLTAASISVRDDLTY